MGKWQISLISVDGSLLVVAVVVVCGCRVFDAGGDRLIVAGKLMVMLTWCWFRGGSYGSTW